ncbi:TRAP transporter small permease [Jannaschia sp. LMIT008]|uniref:TRAP transporter small permease n=1 Tax=Jannaschia maritima TaxID=3032585 RepID=UPI0028115BAB|nr:TRAP transporter small permease [Jannaschia sp. LMIT008]
MLDHAARLSAIAGGAVLVGLILVVCLSILGREANDALYASGLDGSAVGRWLLGAGLGAIPGDFEIVEAGVAFVVSAFLPLAQARGAHARVDLFADRMPVPVRRWGDAVVAVAFAVVLVLIAVQLWSGLVSKMGSGQVTLRLQFPVWWGYAACVPPLALTVAVAFARAASALRMATALE